MIYVCIICCIAGLLMYCPFWCVQGKAVFTGVQDSVLIVLICEMVICSRFSGMFSWKTNRWICRLANERKLTTISTNTAILTLIELLPSIYKNILYLLFQELKYYRCIKTITKISNVILIEFWIQPN